MARQPTRESARTVLTTAGLGAAAVLLAAAAAAPALADDNGNHYGQTKDHSNNGQAGSHGQSGSQGGSGNDESTSATPSDSTTSSTGHNPPGNNGTVFIHDESGDYSPHNVPHVDCTFYVDLFGFDAGQQGTVSFAGQAPTGKDIALGGTWTGTMSTDDAGGAGNDFDQELAFTADQLGVSSLGDPAHQGYHIKMTVVTNQPGDHKYKVFWLQPCGQTAGTTTAPTTETPDTTTTNETGTAVAPTSVGQELAPTEAGDTSESAGTAGEASGAATAESATTTDNGMPTNVLGEHLTRGNAPASAASSAAASLPFTGAEIGGLAAAAAISLGAGTALTVAGRRRRHARAISSS